MDIVLFALVTAFASALHGGDHATKGVAMAIHAIAALLCSVYAVIPAAVFWLFLRRGKQARAEIDYIYGITGAENIRKAYPLGLGYIMRPVIVFATKVEFFGLPSRRRQEVLGGFVLGLILYTPILILELIK